MSAADSKWAPFAGGLLLGSTVAVGAAYVALKYGPTFTKAEPDDEAAETKPSPAKRRPRAGSPLARQPVHSGRRSATYSAHNLAGQSQEPNGNVQKHLERTDTQLYYGNSPPPEPSHLPPLMEQHSQRPAGLANSSGSVRRAHSGQPSSDPRPLPRSLLPQDGNPAFDPLYATDTDVRPPRETYSESEAALSSHAHGVAPRAGAIFAGPSDRANPAVADALRHTASAAAFSHLPAGPAQQAPHASPLRPPGHLSHHHAVHTPNGHVPRYGDSPASAHRSPSQAHVPSPGSTVIISPGYNGGGAIVASPPPPLPPLTTADALATEGRIIEDAALHEQYSRVITPEPAPTEETEEVCYLLQRALDLRQRWLWQAQPLEQEAGLPEAHRMSECLGGDPFSWIPEEAVPVPYSCEMVDGVMMVYSDTSRSERLYQAPGTANEFFADMNWLLKISNLGHVRSFTHHRLQLLEQKFNLHVMLNADKEFLAQKSAPHRDFYNVRKIDTHVHHSACMHQKHLLRFIKSKLKKEADEVVIFRDGKYLTLKEVFESLNLTAYDLSVDTLDVHADKNIFHRFDKFNLKYNPFGQSRLREVFIKQDNLIHGRFLAELTREVFVDLEASKYQHTEYRISVYGRKPVEWDTLAAWVVQNRLYSDNNVWMIQVPRLYNVYKSQGLIESFSQLLENIFTPLFEVTLDPASHPMLHIFLKHVSGFDLVDDESKPERRPTKHMPSPAEWTSKHNPAFSYYTYYIYANLHVLNRLRRSRGFNTFSLRPHAGEAGDIDHLATTFLLAENIAHGINLRRSPSLQYLYYAARVGLCMSPLSNNSLFLDYHRNPFPQFFARGLSVSLSTDDPLQIHLTREPLVEEYSVAAQVWKLSATDLCEVARNSVLHSGFPHRLKQHWVHAQYWRLGPEGNSIQKTNVPALRMVFRKDCHCEEISRLGAGAAAHAARLRAKEAAAE